VVLSMSTSARRLTFGGAGGESKARLFEVFGYAFQAHKPRQ
jgi:hypothetical protein